MHMSAVFVNICVIHNDAVHNIIMKALKTQFWSLHRVAGWRRFMPDIGGGTRQGV